MTSTLPPILVFDLDGTLAETAGDLIATLNYILTREEIAPVSLADGREMVGAGARALIRQGFAASGRVIEPERLEALFREYLEHYEGRIADESHLFPGVADMLDRFAAAGWRFAVCTNKVEGAAVKLLQALAVASRFSAICGQDTFRADGRPISKPDPRALIRTIERAGGDPARAVMIGDSKTDIHTAQAAGIPVVAVDFGYTDQPVSAFAPDRIISGFNQLWDAVESLNIGGPAIAAGLLPFP